MSGTVPFVIVVDDASAFRRRAIASRAEYRVLKRLFEDDNRAIAECDIVLESAAPPRSAELNGLVAGGHALLVIFVHNTCSQRLLHEFATLYSAKELDVASKIVTYTGGRDPKHPFPSLPDGTHLHFNNVSRLGDCKGASAVAMLERASRPRMVDEVLDRVFTELSGGAKPITQATTPVDSRSGGGSRDFQHALTNTLKPLMICVEMAAQRAGGYEEVLARWDAFIKSCERDAGDALPEQVAKLQDEINATVIPHLKDGRYPEEAISRLSLLLASIERHLYPEERLTTDWLLVGEALANHRLQPRPQVLWIEDEPGWKQAWEGMLDKAGIAVEWLDAPRQYVDQPENVDRFDAVLLDVALPGCGTGVAKALERRGIDAPIAITDETAGIGLLQLFRQAATAPPPIFILSAYDSLPVIEACIRLGARGYRTKHRTEWLPFFADLLVAITSHRETRKELLVPLNPSVIVVKSGDPLAGVILRLDQLARSGTRSAVVLVGEAGVGKELLAREFHSRLQRHLGRHGRFVRVDLGSLPASVFESELFGYEKGAFTGAVQARAGFCEQADGGTLFLDEIDKLQPRELQWKLLSLLESDQRTIRRLGSSREMALDLKIIVASNEDPRINRSLFSEPVASRMSLLIRVPSLRDRVAAIQELAQGLCDRVCAQQDRPRTQLEIDAIAWLKRAAEGGAFPANLRSLKSLLERTLAYNDQVTSLSAQHLQTAFAEEQPPEPAGSGQEAMVDAARRLASQLRKEKRVDLYQIEKRLRAELLMALRLDLDRSEIAELFGFTADNLRQMIRQLRKEGFLSEDI